MKRRRPHQAFQKQKTKKVTYSTGTAVCTRPRALLLSCLVLPSEEGCVFSLPLSRTLTRTPTHHASAQQSKTAADATPHASDIITPQPHHNHTTPHHQTDRIVSCHLIPAKTRGSSRGKWPSPRAACTCTGTVRALRPPRPPECRNECRPASTRGTRTPRAAPAPGCTTSSCRRNTIGARTHTHWRVVAEEVACKPQNQATAPASTAIAHAIHPP